MLYLEDYLESMNQSCERKAPIKIHCVNLLCPFSD